MPLVKKQLVHELAAEEIKRLIQTSELQKGDKLPSMADLAVKFGVSRTSIREALRHLEAHQFVEIVNGKGILVKDANAHQLQTCIFIESELTFLLQLCEVRRGLEGQAIELAANRATEEQLNRMETNLGIFKNVKTLYEESVQADFDFHQTLYEASHNPVLYKMIDTVYVSFNEFWKKNKNSDSIFADTYQFHEDIYNYVTNKQPDLAREAFNQMIDIVESRVKEMISKAN